jgi:hypothetical protein
MGKEAEREVYCLHTFGRFSRKVTPTDEVQLPKNDPVNSPKFILEGV